MSQVQKKARVQVEVGARVSQVWALVADVTRIGEWSHECRSARWLGGATGPAPGARFRGRNRAGWARWGRTCEIVALDPPHAFCWRTVPTLLFPDSTEWRIELEPKPGDRTLITQSFAVERAPWVLDRLYALLIPAHRDREARLAQDLERAGAAALREAAP
jgi:uncharacterized protein YndB with AHSA1/START domain